MENFGRMTNKSVHGTVWHAGCYLEGGRMKGITLKSNFIDQFSLRQWDHAIEQQFLSKQILI